MSLLFFFKKRIDTAWEGRLYLLNISVPLHCPLATNYNCLSWMFFRNYPLVISQLHIQQAWRLTGSKREPRISILLRGYVNDHFYRKIFLGKIWTEGFFQNFEKPQKKFFLTLIFFKNSRWCFEKNLFKIFSKF